ncbi:cation diffusion facilitator family transporter [Parvularcula maris]|uniref:Protein p34 n=1 Tax=Parvularcula maris TaxID=2965077 RepID=A0A9X2L8K7_9PROT|nr:cation diffusion facilitator family transporter [Parvularcula maris]MCQ8184961.1 cation diffusion facilitator family transporter [Parvularcula maris]
MHGTFDSTQKGSFWAKAATGAAIGAALFLVAAKAYAFAVSGSVAVLGSLTDSALDLAGSLGAFLAVRYAAMPADDDHRFGHQKAEALSALGQSVLIGASALFLAVESVKRLLDPEPVQAAGAAMAVLVLGLVVTAGLVAFQSYALKRSGNLVVEGDRAHYTGDLIAHGGALVAVFLASRFGISWADALAGLVAAGFLAWSVKSILGAALPQVMDQELPDDDVAAITAILDSEEEAAGWHHLRTRRSGGRRFVQLHLDLLGDMTLAEAHTIADRVERRIEDAFPDADVIVHQDPV